jgi:hypothetical protein
MYVGWAWWWLSYECLNLTTLDNIKYNPIKFPHVFKHILYAIGKTRHLIYMFFLFHRSTPATLQIGIAFGMAYTASTTYCELMKYSIFSLNVQYIDLNN